MQWDLPLSCYTLSLNNFGVAGLPDEELLSKPVIQMGRRVIFLKRETLVIELLV